MATFVSIVVREVEARVEALIRQNPANALDGLRWIRRQLFGGPARPAANPAVLQEVANQGPGNALVVANGSTTRRWMWWVGDGVVGAGIIWLLRRDGGEAAEIVEAGEGNNGGGGNADGGGDGRLDPGLLLFQMVNLIGWKSGDNSGNGDAAATTAAGGDSDDVGDVAKTTEVGGDGDGNDLA